MTSTSESQAPETYWTPALKPTADEIVDLVMKPMARIFTRAPVSQANPQEYAEMVNQYVRQLVGFRQEVLERGLLNLERDWTHQTWPTPAKLRSFMCEAEAELRPQPPKIEHKPEPEYEPTPEERAEVSKKLQALVAKLKAAPAPSMKPVDTPGPAYVPMPAHVREQLVASAEQLPPKGEG